MKETELRGGILVLKGERMKGRIKLCVEKVIGRK